MLRLNCYRLRSNVVQIEGRADFCETFSAKSNPDPRFSFQSREYRNGLFLDVP